ncbi:MAG: hypothetical protein OXD50_08470 [Chloroflexi bacterium]|nr:hypothetical protein [Chloroflexota bacterium]
MPIPQTAPQAIPHALPQASPQAIHQRYWQIANSSDERGYVQVRALDSLARLLDLFPRPDHPGFFACDPEPPQSAIPDGPYAIASLSDEDLDALIEREEAAAKTQTDTEAEANTESEPDDEDEEGSNQDEDEPP